MSATTTPTLCPGDPAVFRDGVECRVLWVDTVDREWALVRVDDEQPHLEPLRNLSPPPIEVGHTVIDNAGDRAEAIGDHVDRDHVRWLLLDYPDGYRAWREADTCRRSAS